MISLYLPIELGITSVTIGNTLNRDSDKSKRNQTERNGKVFFHLVLWVREDANGHKNEKSFEN